MPVDFIADTSQRIQARNLRAEPVIAELSGTRRFMAKSSLAIANGVDRFGGWMSNGAAAALAGAIFGAVRGGLAGGALSMVVAGLGFTGAAPVLGLIMFAGFFLHDTARSYNVMKADDPRYTSAKRADWIASQGGALGPQHVPHPSQAVENRHAIRQIKAQNGEAKFIARTTDLEPEPTMTFPGGIVPGGFADKELKRRANSGPDMGNKGQSF